MSQDAALQRYFEEAASWDADRAAMAARSTRIAWRIAIGACVLTAAAILALVLLMPLKRVEPFVIRVDNSTGIVDVVPIYAGDAQLPETLTRQLLTLYVQVCERFNFATAESDYAECSAFHAAARQRAWENLWDRSNPTSPLNMHKDGSWVRAQVRAISFLTRANGVADLAQIRYTKSRRDASGGGEQVTHWIATVQYVYGKPSEDPAVRVWNQIGFKIVEFLSEPEVVPEAPPPSGHSVPSAAPTAPAGAT